MDRQGCLSYDGFEIAVLQNQFIDMTTISIDVQTLAETEALGERLAARLFPGSVVALVGTLGAGKTNLVRAIAVGLQIPNPDIVNSPTFVLIQEYDALLPIYHFDAYRLQREADFADLGVHEYFQGNGVCLVEWADKVPSCMPKEHLEIRITVTGESSRHFEMIAHGRRYESMLAFLP
jgi:tRNA threonylcarbamoyladenosine biosynthesis protein TsaE